MVLYESLDAIGNADADVVGSKAKALAELAARGFSVPSAICISADAYTSYMAETRLGDRVIFELGRKRFDEMRWEEIWDTSLRIRNMFLSTALPPKLSDQLGDAVCRQFGDTPVVVRSSAPGEDSADASFAGLHDSFVNVRGRESILKHVRLVWASLWSDAALLYRQELGLDVRRSRMAVIVQSLVDGECSGVAFSRDPSGGDESVIESVHGLNAGLVDGTVEPDRWTIDRTSGQITSHRAPQRQHLMVATPAGIELSALDAARSQKAPLCDAGVRTVYELARNAERRFGTPQDVEWTRLTPEADAGKKETAGKLLVLQSRPITTIPHEPGDDKRPWYRSLTRSFENLQVLRRRIEEEIVPGMEQDAAALAEIDLAGLSTHDLAMELSQRERTYVKWRDVYWDDCIPFAHGVRLFGQYYNDVMQPADPYAFMDLLKGTGMLSMARNRDLQALAAMIRTNPSLRSAIEHRQTSALPVDFASALDRFEHEHGDIAASTATGPSLQFLEFLLQLASDKPDDKAPVSKGQQELADDFLLAVPEGERQRAEELLDLARASHRWRDDDNVYLDAVEAQWRAAQTEARRRENGASATTSTIGGTGECTLESESAQSDSGGNQGESVPTTPMQIVGQPAGPGLATGRARVVFTKEDLLQFKRGEVLVCDALNPTMTFVIPLASAVVERRGGMLIHGAIIAREYGIPCVTGVPDAADRIKSGVSLTVDGYLGIVRVGRDEKVNRD